jgi:hypothetical protein
MRRNTLNPLTIHDLLREEKGREPYTAEIPGKDHSFRIMRQDCARLENFIKTPF